MSQYIRLNGDVCEKNVYLFIITVTSFDQEVCKFLYLSLSRDPNSDDGPSTLTTWPEYDTATQKYIRFRADQETFPVEDHFAASRVNFWHHLIPVMSQECDKECPKCKSNVSGATSLKMTLMLIVLLWTIKWV